MRRWRVGTLSMGITLILLGSGLLWTMWGGMEAFDFITRWWPLLLVLLGVEILIYLAVSKKENGIIHYDVFSVFFVGVLCVGALAFSAFASTGVLQEFREHSRRVEHTLDLPEFREPVGQSVKKIVVHSGISGLVVQRSDAAELQLFGTYQVSRAPGENPSAMASGDVATVHLAGSTLFVEVKDIARQTGLFSEGDWIRSATLTVPEHIPVELNGAYPPNETPVVLP